MLQVAQIMGMPITIDIPDYDVMETFDECFNLLRKIDAQFSPYKKTSELSKFKNGEIEPQQLSKDMRDIKKACDRFTKLTAGYFSAYYDGTFDPTGYVIGWAIRQTANLIESKGLGSYSINAGGDIMMRSCDDHVWHTGLQHPLNTNQIFGTVSAKNLSIATSGNYARGDHILNPKDYQPARQLKSVSVIGLDIITADVFATAIFAMGKKGINFIDKQEGYEALLIDSKLNAFKSKQFDNY